MVKSRAAAGRQGVPYGPRHGRAPGGRWRAQRSAATTSTATSPRDRTDSAAAEVE